MVHDSFLGKGLRDYREQDDIDHDRDVLQSNSNNEPVAGSLVSAVQISTIQKPSSLADSYFTVNKE